VNARTACPCFPAASATELRTPTSSISNVRELSRTLSPWVISAISVKTSASFFGSPQPPIMMGTSTACNTSSTVFAACFGDAFLIRGSVLMSSTVTRSAPNLSTAILAHAAGSPITSLTCIFIAFGYPHTSCGCFEAVAFYIPEVDGLGIIHRGFKEPAVNGLTFSVLADSTAGGRQVDGFHGISFEYMRSPKFLQADGGWNRIVWMPESAKERVKDFIPKEVVDKIATEKDVSNVAELKAWLQEKGHPVVERWKAAPAEVSVEEKEEAEVPAEAAVEAETLASMPILSSASIAGGFKVILKNTKIHAKKVRIKRREK